MNGNEPRTRLLNLWKRPAVWIAAIVTIAVVTAVVWLAATQPPTVDIRPLTGAEPGENTCWADPFELGDVYPGKEVAFTNHTTGPITITNNTGLFVPPLPSIEPGATKRFRVTSDAAAGKHLYSVSCAPLSVGESRPRVIVRGSPAGTAMPGGKD